MFLSTQSTAASNAHLTQQNAKLRAEIERLKAEIERLQDLQSPEHARLERIATAAMQAILTGGNPGNSPEDLAWGSVTAARALIAELDGKADS